MKTSSSITHAQIIARAWLDAGYRAELQGQGVDVPPCPDDLQAEDIEHLADARYPAPAAATAC